MAIAREATPVASAADIKEADLDREDLLQIYRNMLVTRGTEPWRIFAQYMGRADGLARGKDGNVHMADFRLGLIAMVSHLPALLPVAVGCALAFKIRKESRVAVGWCGDGAMA